MRRRTTALIVSALVSAGSMVGCTTTEVVGPAPTVTMTVQPSSEPRAPSDPLADFEALSLCAARTLEASPFGSLPLERTLDPAQVHLRTDGRWWVVIDQFDPNAIPDGPWGYAGDSWAYCLLGGSIGDVEWWVFGGTIEEPSKSPDYRDPNYLRGVDWDIYD